ncbi:glycosyltransferase [Vibrio chagasii]|uniref:glycosyltransferase family 2 protein n=1 Tax=Vibrio chagasii TaxID=170679 RepID=UPI001EFD628B|nr:glycosyltransferase [Vibrio chagasii]MCG9674491.1 glycosyltransferase [Vibrio chagasii]
MSNNIDFSIRGGQSASFRDKQDLISREYFKRISNKREKGISAIYRVKNGSTYLELSILSIAPLVSEIIVVDNNSTDNTVQIAKKLQSELKGICDIKIYSYDISPILAGEGYLDSVRNEPHRSLAKFYEYCFSKATQEYVMKCDAHYVFTPRALDKIQRKLRNGPNILRFRGSEIFGRTLSLEPFIFKRTINYKFVDDIHFEVLQFERPVRKTEFLRSTIIEPCFLHLKRLSYSKYINLDVKDKVTKALYK